MGSFLARLGAARAVVVLTVSAIVARKGESYQIIEFSTEKRLVRGTELMLSDWCRTPRGWFSKSRKMLWPQPLSQPKEEFEFSSLPGKFFLIFAFGDEANGNKAKTTRKYAFDLTLK